MFCSECGQQAAGKFCWNCGELLQATTPKEKEAAHDELANVDWTALTDYQTLIKIPAVRNRIAEHAARAKKKLSGEDFLEACDKVLSPLTGGVPLTVIAKFTQPISERLGLKMDRTRRERLAEPPGKVIVALLCSLAENSQTLGEVTQSAGGCTLRAKMPSDIWSLKGDLVVDVRVEGSTTVVEAGLTIPGQVYDWGKSRRALDRLFADVTSLAKVA